jgi:hypothetical protein
VPWKFRLLDPIEKENDQLRTVVIQLRRELTDKEGYAAKLELVARQRSRTIDALRGKLEQVRAQNRRLDEEAEHLALDEAE